MAEVGSEGGLCGLVFEVAAEAGSAEASAKVLLFGAEEVFCSVVRSFDNGDDCSVVIADHRMTEEVLAVVDATASRQRSKNCRCGRQKG